LNVAVATILAEATFARDTKSLALLVLQEELVFSLTALRLQRCAAVDGYQKSTSLFIADDICKNS